MYYDMPLPKRWNKDLAYMCGLITGDGSMPNTSSSKPNGELQKRYSIQFFCKEKKFCKLYQKIFEKLFLIRPRIEARKRVAKNVIYVCRIESMKVYKFLENLGMKVGRKARIATVPNMPKKYHVYFLAGLLDTDGGKKGSGFGLCTASAKLANFCKKTFQNLKIPYKSCPWIYRNHTYHQIYVNNKHVLKILPMIPIQNPGKIRFIKSFSK